MKYYYVTIYNSATSRIEELTISTANLALAMLREKRGWIFVNVLELTKKQFTEIRTWNVIKDD